MSSRRFAQASLLASAALLWATTEAVAAAEQPPANDRAGIEATAADDVAPAPAPPQAPRGVVVPATLVARETEVPPGESDPVATLNAPFTNAQGQVGFTGSLATASGADGFVWLDAGIVWHNSDATTAVLTGGESTMGISDAGGFVYSPAADGNDAVWTHTGALLVEGDPAPGYAPPALSTFNSRPHMVATGQAYWVGGVSVSGGGTTEARALYTSPTASSGDVQVVLRSGDVVGGYTIAGGSSGIDFDYDVSSDGAHHIQSLLMATGSTADDGFVYVDGALVARESEPTGTGDNWDNFDAMAINRAGHYLFSGDTDGDFLTDEYVAYDGAIAIREGDTIDGVTLLNGAAVVALSLADDGRAAQIWDDGNTFANVHLFHACDAAALATSVRVLTVPALVDFDGDGLADSVVTAIRGGGAVGPAVDLAEDGRVFLAVTLDDADGVEDAIIALRLPVCELFLDGFETGDTSRWTSAVP